MKKFMKVLLGVVGTVAGFAIDYND